MAGCSLRSPATPSITLKILESAAPEPRGLLRNRHVQSILGSLPAFGAVRRRIAMLRAGSEPLVLDCGQGVRLQAFYAAPREARRVAVLLHGWEGSADSRCVLSLGAALFHNGFGVLRLNLRDHGLSHHLNREIFHSCRLSDVSGALSAVAALMPDAALFLAGFSLGGNFLLRAAAETGLPQTVRTVAAISPVLHPERTLVALEQGPWIYRRFLARRWTRSLRRKQRLWPGVHDFRFALGTRDLRRMTAALVREHTSFASLYEYLHGYALTSERLSRLAVPCGLLLAEDDPLVPSDQLAELSLPPRLHVQRTRYGGHCGFIGRAGELTLAERFVLEQFARFG